jgi:transposase
MTGPGPVDRGKAGSKAHVLSDADGLPLQTAVSAANTWDGHALNPCSSRSRRSNPDAGHGAPGPPNSTPTKPTTPLNCGNVSGTSASRPVSLEKGVERNDRLGKHRCKIERTIAWLTGHRRLSPRHERHDHPYVAFLTPAATLICFKKLTK